MGIKMGFTEKIIGHMTMKKYIKLLKAYRDIFDMELTMTKKDLRYSELNNEASLDEAIPF